MIGRSGALFTLAVSLFGTLGSPPGGPAPTPPPAPPAASAPSSPSGPATGAPATRTTTPPGSGKPSAAGGRTPGAKAGGRTTELTDQRTDTSTAYRFPNGTRMLVLSAGPVRQQRDGKWGPVDLTLRRNADGSVGPVAAPYPTTLSGGGPGVTGTPGAAAGAAGIASGIGAGLDVASVRGPSGLVTALPWTGPLPAPRLHGNQATYRNVRPGTDLLVEVTRIGFVAELAPSGSAPVTGPGLALRDTRPGSAAEPVPALSALAATAAPAGTLADVPVADRVIASVVHRDSPPLVTSVQNTAPGADLAGDPDLRIGSFDGSTVSRGLLTWDLGALRGQQVQQATLRLYSEWASSCTPRAWQVWSAAPANPGVRWADQPAAQKLWATSTTVRGATAGGCGPGWTNVDVTPLVRQWAASGATSGTILLRAANERDPGGWMRFSSGDGPNPPALGVTLAPRAG
jgi:hypothetical protein